MKRERIFGAVVGIFLTIAAVMVPAAAYADHGFSIDIPGDWTPDLNLEQNVHGWISPAGDAELIVAIAENADGGNPYDLSEEDMPEVADEIGNRSLESLQAGYAQQGYEADVRQESLDCSLLEWGDGQPALVMDSSYLVCDTQDEESFTLYIYACILVGREHSFSVWYQTQEPDAMESAKESGVMETFRITEETYSGPTSVWAAWGDVIYYAGLACLSAVVAVSGLRELLGRGKKKKEEPEKGPGGHLPPRK